MQVGLSRSVFVGVVFLLLIISSGLAGAVPEEQWNKTFGGKSYDGVDSVQQTSDGGYILAGSTESFGAGDHDAWLIKTDSEGNKQWDKTFGGKSYDYAYSVQQTSDGGYILAGSTESFGAGDADAWLIKTDSEGNKQWDKTFGGKSSDHAISVYQTSDGGYILAGSTESFGAGDHDAWLIKTDSEGNKQWDKTFGGKSYDYAHSVQQTSDGGYILTGLIDSDGCEYGDAWLIKTDSKGNEQWSKTFGNDHLDVSRSVQQTSDGGYVLACMKNHVTGVISDAGLIKTDPEGNKQWDKTFSGLEPISSNVRPDDVLDWAYSVHQTSDGGYILAGFIESDGCESGAWLIKTDSEGNKQWDKTFGEQSHEGACSVQQTSDGGYILAGLTHCAGCYAEYYDAWLIKLGEQNVNTALVAAFSIESPQIKYIGDIITFDASQSSGNIASYTWFFGDEPFNSKITVNGLLNSGKTVKHIYTKPGEYEVTLKITDTEGNSKTITKTLTINAEYENAILQIDLVGTDKTADTHNYNIVITKCAPMVVDVQKYSNGDYLKGIEVGSAFSHSHIETFGKMLPEFVLEEAISLFAQSHGLEVPVIYNIYSNIQSVIEYYEYKMGYDFFKAAETTENTPTLIHIPYKYSEMLLMKNVQGQTDYEPTYEEMMDLILSQTTITYQQTPEQYIYVSDENIGLSSDKLLRYPYIKVIDPATIPDALSFYYEPYIVEKEISPIPKISISTKRILVEYGVHKTEALLSGIPVYIDGIYIGRTSENGVLDIYESQLTDFSKSLQHTLTIGEGEKYSKKEMLVNLNKEGTIYKDVYLNKDNLPLIPHYVSIFAEYPSDSLDIADPTPLYPSFVTYPHAKSIQNFLLNSGTSAVYLDPNNEEIRKSVFDDNSQINDEVQYSMEESDWLIILCSSTDFQKPLGVYRRQKFSVDEKSESIIKEGNGWKILKYNSKKLGSNGEPSQILYYLVTEDNTEYVEVAVNEFLQIIENELELSSQSIPLESSTGKGTVYFDTSTATIEDLFAVPLTDVSIQPPSECNLEYGLFRFNVGNIKPGATVTLDLFFPEELPPETTYWKFGKTSETPVSHWYMIPCTIDGNRLTISIEDGGLGDDDLIANGKIQDDGGPSIKNVASHKGSNVNEELVSNILKDIQSAMDSISEEINLQMPDDLKNTGATSNFYSIGLILILVIGVIMLYRKS